MFKRILLLAAVMVITLSMCAVPASAEDLKTITLADGASATNADGVIVDGDVIRIMKAGEYLVSGMLTNGQISVECGNDAKVKLYFNGVSIHCENGPAVLVSNMMTRCTISLVNQTENFLSNGENLVFDNKDEEPNGVIFSRSDLTISGAGTLTVTAGAMDGIVSKDDLRIKEGTVTVTAPRHGIRGKDYIQISGARVSVTAGKDGLRTTENNREDRGFIEIVDSAVEIKFGDDGFSYETWLTVSNSALYCVSVNNDD